MKLKHLLLIFLWTYIEISGFKVLGIFPFLSKSHYFLGNELLKGVAKAGHEVTMLTVYKDKTLPKNGTYKEIILEDVKHMQEELYREVYRITNPLIQSFAANPFVLLTQFYVLGNILSEAVLNNSKVQELIKSNEKFDVVILPQFGMEAVKVLASHFGGHLVLFTNNELNSWINHFVGNPNLPSLNADIFLAYPGEMTFFQRLKNTIFNLNIYDSLYNVSLILSNSHPSLNKPTSSVPCMKEIGGFHVKPPKKLPEDLQMYLDEAKDGVIYFSMGSFLKGSALTVEMRNAFMNAFSRRKEKILWKFENDIEGLSGNVRIEKWLPQSDILAHPNVKLFITHGGFLSTIETVYHAVPTIAIPIFGDQEKNAQAAESFGYAYVIKFYNISEESISEGIEEVISNKRYRDNAKLRSTLFHDRPKKPLDEAVYWIEYIVKYNGAKHLRVDYLDLSWYQWYLLDVFVSIFIVTISSLFVLNKVLHLCIRNQKKIKQH